MTNEQLDKLQTIIKAFENVEVKGQQNLLNLGGGIAMLKELAAQCANDIADLQTGNKEEHNG